jgi:hypothetical protein
MTVECIDAAEQNGASEQDDMAEHVAARVADQ